MATSFREIRDAIKIPLISQNQVDFAKSNFSQMHANRPVMMRLRNIDFAKSTFFNRQFREIHVYHF